VPKNKYVNRTSPIWTSQNFLTSSSVINRIVKLVDLTKNDHIVEIGPGKGHITDRLIARCGRGTAVEIDRSLYNRLLIKYEGRRNVSLVCCDFLCWHLPKTPYKVFANIPFSRTTDIVRKLTMSGNPPEEAWLVMEKGAAKRFMGKPHETKSALLIKPYFDSEIKYYFRREDFHPAPSVDAVLLHLKKKEEPDMSRQQYPAYSRFITQCLSKPNGIYAILTKKQVSTALKRKGLSSDISGEILYIQWLCLFRCYMKYGRHTGG
jgi:23S rRNA (adenine-N6)-dimethyltransferase